MIDGRPVFDRLKCQKCHTCEKNCLQNAISFVGEQKTVAEIMAMILRDRAYYENSGGGVTISGGEAYTQFEGLMELLQACKEAGLRTAIETCAHVPTERMLASVPYVDLFLFDLKHIEPEKFHEFTGGKLSVIMDNLRELAKVAAEKITVRVPVIPGFNFDKPTITGIFQMAVDCRIKEVHLLPYHTFGIAKYERLGKKYLLDCQTSLHKEDLAEYKTIGESLGLTVKVGG